MLRMVETSRADVLAWLKIRPGWRRLIFIVAPLVGIILLYVAPAYRVPRGNVDLDMVRICLGTLIVADIVLLCVYLTKYSPQDLQGAITAVANVVGPVLAYWYAFQYYDGTLELLKNGGDVLIQTAFFWTGYVACLAYAGSLARQGGGKALTGLFAVSGVMIVPVLLGRYFVTWVAVTGPPLVWVGDASGSSGAALLRVPDVTVMMIARVVTSGYGIGFATRPAGER